MSEASAAQHYFDPPDPTPTCEICDEPQHRDEPYDDDWNGETGNHVSCEERQEDEHEHVWGPVEYARMTGNPHRKCQGCRFVSLDLEDDE